MTWLTWRHLRVQALVLAAAAAALVAVLLSTAPTLQRMYHERAADFLPRLSADGALLALYYAGCVAVLALPAVIGAFWGAPLVARELETGTYRLAWTQTISRTRWLVTRLGITGLVSAGLTAALSLAMSHWTDPIDTVGRTGGTDGPVGVFELTRMTRVIYDTRGVAPIGFTLLALLLGVGLGMLARRTVPAMALTLAVYVALQVAVPLWVRPHLVAPIRTTVAITVDNLHGLQAMGTTDDVDALVVDVTRPGAWILGNDTTREGAVVRPPGYVGSCLPLPGSGPAAPTRPGAATPAIQACFDRLAREGYRQRITYQPSSRFWALQWRELGLYLAASVLLAGLCFRRIGRLS